ncbi:MAG: DUF4142 domain-containing protein [Sphingomonadaceae bacterium]|nr:DUF4142 domain-containing protein [Sphingomonadaceae bacterium]
MNRALLLSVALLTLAACGESKNVANEAETSAGDAAIETATAVDPAPATTLPASGTGTAAGYAAAAAQGDMYEVEAGRIALERSNSPEIKQFAQTMVDSHSATTAELRTALATAGLAVTPALDPRHQALLDALRAASPLEFDTAYLDQQSVVHGEALRLHRSYAESGDNSVVRAFAAKTAPVVQAHLDMAKKLDESGADEPAANPPQ